MSINRFWFDHDRCEINETQEWISEKHTACYGGTTLKNLHFFKCCFTKSYPSNLKLLDETSSFLQFLTCVVAMAIIYEQLMPPGAVNTITVLSLEGFKQTCRNFQEMILICFCIQWSTETAFSQLVWKLLQKLYGLSKIEQTSNLIWSLKNKDCTKMYDCSSLNAKTYRELSLQKWKELNKTLKRFCLLAF